MTFEDGVFCRVYPADLETGHNAFPTPPFLLSYFASYFEEELSCCEAASKFVEKWNERLISV